MIHDNTTDKKVLTTTGIFRMSSGSQWTFTAKEYVWLLTSAWLFRRDFIKLINQNNYWGLNQNGEAIKW